jgi:hypothetical protein
MERLAVQYRTYVLICKRPRARSRRNLEPNPSCCHRVNARSSLPTRELFILRSGIPSFHVLSLEVVHSRGAQGAGGVGLTPGEGRREEPSAAWTKKTVFPKEGVDPTFAGRAL